MTICIEIWGVAVLVGTWNVGVAPANGAVLSVSLVGMVGYNDGLSWCEMTWHMFGHVGLGTWRSTGPRTHPVCRVEDGDLVAALGRGVVDCTGFSGPSALAGVGPFAHCGRQVNVALTGHMALRVSLEGGGFLGWPLVCLSITCGRNFQKKPLTNCRVGFVIINRYLTHF